MFILAVHDQICVVRVRTMMEVKRQEHCVWSTLAIDRTARGKNHQIPLEPPVLEGADLNRPISGT